MPNPRTSNVFGESRKRERLLKAVNRGGSGSGIASWGLVVLLVFLAAVNAVAF